MLQNRFIIRSLVSAMVVGGLSALPLPSHAAHHGAAHHATASAVRRSTPRDSYLQYKVYNIEQLIQQVSDNPVVRKRFADHFHIPEHRVVSYMRANLVESYVPKTARYTVYCARRSGTFYPVKQTFKRGTKVFALRNGEPVMKWVCGNPLSKFLPDVQVRKIPRPVKTKVSPTIQELGEADPVKTLVPAEIAAPMYQPAVPLNVASASSPLLLHAGGNSLLPFLLPVALIGIHSGGHHTPPPVTPAVPEAGTLAYLAAGVPLALAAIRRRRQRRA